QVTNVSDDGRTLAYVQDTWIPRRHGASRPGDRARAPHRGWRAALRTHQPGRSDRGRRNGCGRRHRAEADGGWRTCVRVERLVSRRLVSRGIPHHHPPPQSFSFVRSRHPFGSRNTPRVASGVATVAVALFTRRPLGRLSRLPECDTAADLRGTSHRTIR